MFRKNCGKSYANKDSHNKIALIRLRKTSLNLSYDDDVYLQVQIWGISVFNSYAEDDMNHTLPNIKLILPILNI